MIQNLIGIDTETGKTGIAFSSRKLQLHHPFEIPYPTQSKFLSKLWGSWGLDEHRQAQLGEKTLLTRQRSEDSILAASATGSYKTSSSNQTLNLQIWHSECCWAPALRFTNIFSVLLWAPTAAAVVWFRAWFAHLPRKTLPWISGAGKHRIYSSPALRAWWK